LVALLAVVAGHVWPVQLGFRGGKGVSTSLAGLLIYDWRLAVIYIAAFVAILALMRRTVAASLIGFALLPWMYYWWLAGDEKQIWGISVLAALIILAHHRNIMEGFSELWSRRGAGEQPDPSVKEL
jgi:glycerol-3-phosphate acyltransferase PlsY